ncbi:hypothetical protein [Pseudoalteromonas ostreae]|uniref:hypothetical protein n=1 Tax=Pseudoalteromonas ostreae TaxID=2774154 RepID=UPI001B37F87E|nr:hypothetical protein [Pseudoalteromonas ostreae]
MYDILAMLRSGEIHPMHAVAVFTILVSMSINVIVSKVKGYKVRYAIAAALPPYLNIWFSVGYILMAIFKKKQSQ